LCTDGSILITAKEKELILDTSDVKEIVIHYHQSYDGRGDIAWYNHNSVSIIPGDDNTIKITSKEGKIFNYFFLSEYKEDLGYLNELVSHWNSIGINVIFTTNEKYKKS